MLRLLPIVFAVFISAVGYGVTFPLIGIRLDQTGADGWLIGLNAAVPALGWLIGSFLVPILQLRLRIRIGTLAFAFLTIATCALAGLRYADDYLSMTVLRFFFGGSMGLFYRSVEYWINGLSENEVRGRNLSINGVCMMLGLVVGSLLQPAVGDNGWLAFAPPMAMIAIAAAGTFSWPALSAPPAQRVSIALACGCIGALPIAFLAALVYGLYESIPAYIAPIYALRNNLGPDVAAYTLTAAALGNILIPIPLALLSDRIGRLLPLIFAAIAAAACSFAIPHVLHDPHLFLALLFGAAGLAGTVYGLGLAMIGDRFQGADLVVANSAFGMTYALASLTGPLLNGAALDTEQSHGVMLMAGVLFLAFGLLLVGLGRLGRTR